MKSIFLLLLSSVSASFGANILGIFTSTGPSHLIVHMAVVKTLVERGHNVTVVTTLPLKERNPKYHHVQVTPSKEDNDDYRRKLEAAASGLGALDSFKHLVSANIQRVRMQDKALSHPRFKEILANDGNHFDLVILGWVFNTFQLGVAAHFKCPVIVNWVNVPGNNILSLVGNPQAIASVPVFLPRTVGPMGFRSRVKNFLISATFAIIDRFTEYKMEQYYDEHFPADRYPSYDEMKKNVSLIFCNTHFSEGIVRPMVPAFIEIGGIQVKEKPDPLPRDIHQFLRSSDEGFIILSLGSNVKSSDLPANTTQAIFNVLSRGQHKVIWKWDSGSPPGRAANIMFRKWLPQDDLLAHMNARLFITHAGKGSVAEAQFHGVPMLAIPIYGDQFAIAERMRHVGHGLVADLRWLTEATFERQLREVLENDTYSESVLDFSMLYRDRPMTSRQSVVYWTEYVLRYQGAKHMQSPAVYLNLFQLLSLDVVGFLIFFACLVLVAVKLLVSILCCSISKKKIKRN